MISVEQCCQLCDLRLLRNVCLSLFLLGILFTFLDYCLIPAPRLDAARSGPGTKVTQAFTITPAIDEAAYLQSLRTSRFFGYVPEGSGLTVIRSSIADLSKDLRLKGVVSLDAPEAIVLDARTRKSIFVKSGDIIGDLRVKSIEGDSITLEYLGETKELRIE